MEIKARTNFNHFVNEGVYMINPSVFDQLKLKELYHVMDLICEAKSWGMQVPAFPTRECRIDIGQHEDCQLAQQNNVYA